MILLLKNGPRLHRAKQILEYAASVPDGGVQHAARQLITCKRVDLSWLNQVDGLRAYLLNNGLTVESSQWTEPLTNGVSQAELLPIEHRTNYNGVRGFKGFGAGSTTGNILASILGLALLGGLVWYIVTHNKPVPKRSREYERFPGILGS